MFPSQTFSEVGIVDLLKTEASLVPDDLVWAGALGLKGWQRPKLIFRQVNPANMFLGYTDRSTDLFIEAWATLSSVLPVTSGATHGASGLTVQALRAHLQQYVAHSLNTDYLNDWRALKLEREI